MSSDTRRRYYTSQRRPPNTSEKFAVWNTCQRNARHVTGRYINQHPGMYLQWGPIKRRTRTSPSTGPA